MSFRFIENILQVALYLFFMRADLEKKVAQDFFFFLNTFFQPRWSFLDHFLGTSPQKSHPDLRISGTNCWCGAIGLCWVSTLLGR